METVYEVTDSEITLKKETETIKIWFFGDIHRDAPSCDVDRWKWFLSESKRQMDDNTYFFGLGDYNDFASATEQRAIHGGKLHRETILKFDEVVKRDNRRLASEMKHMRGQIIALIEGNHSWEFFDGQTATEDLATRLDTNCHGWLNHHSIRVGFKNSNKKQYISIVACHGKAGGRTEGNTLNQVNELRQVFPVADIYIMGHDHQRVAKPASILVPSYRDIGVKLKQKRQFLCRIGSFKKAYTPGVSSYEVGRLLKPADLGALLLEISFHRDRDRKIGKDILITDITAKI